MRTASAHRFSRIVDFEAMHMVFFPARNLSPNLLAPNLTMGSRLPSFKMSTRFFGCRQCHADNLPRMPRWNLPRLRLPRHPGRLSAWHCRHPKKRVDISNEGKQEPIVRLGARRLGNRFEGSIYFGTDERGKFVRIVSKCAFCCNPEDRSPPEAGA